MSKRSHRGGRKYERSRKQYPQYTGKAKMSRDGFIFVAVEGLEEEIFVRAARSRRALNGDTVLVAVTKHTNKAGRRMEGEVVKIVERSTKPFVGILHFVGAKAWVIMQSRTMPYDIEASAEEAVSLGGKEGMKVAVLVQRWDRGEDAPWGKIVDVLGMPGENDTEMHAILSEFGLPYRFEKSVEDEAERISEDITPEEISKRRDCRDITTFTIDPADAKDFDDALSLKRLPGGNLEVGVHIADVSHYVTPDTEIDREAQARGTSVYLVDRTVPMLPEKLCNRLCSLRPDEDKLTFSTIFEITPKGKVVSRWFGRTVIRSDARYDYDGAQALIENPEKAESDTDKAIVELYKLSSILREKRFKSGAINFERPEMKVECDAVGKPVRVYQKISREANWLIEEFMLLSNRSVAEFIATAGRMNGKTSPKAKTFVYRVHAEPDLMKIRNLRDFAGIFGYKMPPVKDEGEVSNSLRKLLESAKDKPEFNAFEMMALRAMAKASYSTDNIGHYGLAFSFYTHFTSPIRRYPDTMVHRLLALYLEGKESQSKDYYDFQCRHASEREIVASEAERASIKYKLVEFMEDKVGQEFDGSVSGVTEWGMYVEIEPSKVEGMIPLRDIKSDFYVYDEKHFCLSGRRSGKKYRLGDPVRIRVKSTNLEQKLLDYELIENMTTHKKNTI